MRALAAKIVCLILTMLLGAASVPALPAAECPAAQPVPAGSSCSCCAPQTSRDCCAQAPTCRHPARPLAPIQGKTSLRLDDAVGPQPAVLAMLPAAPALAFAPRSGFPPAVVRGGVSLQSLLCLRTV
jgi:hypothetical protein